MNSILQSSAGTAIHVISKTHEKGLLRAEVFLPFELNPSQTALFQRNSPLRPSQIADLTTNHLPPALRVRAGRQTSTPGHAAKNMRRKQDKRIPPTPEKWVTSRKCDRKIERAEIAARKRIMGERTTATPCCNPPATKQPKQQKPLPQGWAEVNAFSFRRSIRKANCIMATEIASFLAKG